MDLKSIFTLVGERYLAPTVVVILILSAPMSYIWIEYKQLNEKKDQLNAERNSFYEEKSSYERKRSDDANALAARQLDLEKREFILQQHEADYKERFAIFQQAMGKYKQETEQLQLRQVAVSQNQRLKEADEKIQKLMSEFSEMGVDLSDEIRCGDSDALARHNAAKSKLSEIYTLAKANGLIDRFNYFIQTNNPILVSLGCKQEQ